jgi:polysaccharide biosynthesis/export protein
MAQGRKIVCNPSEATLMLKLLRPLFALLALILMAPVATAQTAYRVSPGDVLQMEVLEDPSMNRPLLVLPDGSVSVPQAGTIRAGGLSVAEVQAAVISALTPSFAKAPTVYLAVGQLAPRTTGSSASRAPRTMPVYAMGEVAKPGMIEVAPRTTLLQFLAQSGGFTNFAATKRIQVRRTDAAGTEHVYQFNYAALLSGAHAPVIWLQEGDVIIVPQRKLFE